jgi:hypothetical protein
MPDASPQRRRIKRCAIIKVRGSRCSRVGLGVECGEVMLNDRSESGCLEQLLCIHEEHLPFSPVMWLVAMIASRGRQSRDGADEQWERICSVVVLLCNTLRAVG